MDACAILRHGVIAAPFGTGSSWQNPSPARLRHSLDMPGRGEVPKRVTFNDTREHMDTARVGTASHQVGGYYEFPPPPDLADAVEALWIHQAPQLHVPAHRVVPDAAVSFSFMGMRAPDGSPGGARLRIIGPVSRPHTFAPPPGHRMESVRIKLEWCRRLLGVAPSEHVDDEPLYADVRPDLALPLEARLARSANVD